MKFQSECTSSVSSLTSLTCCCHTSAECLGRLGLLHPLSKLMPSTYLACPPPILFWLCAAPCDNHMHGICRLGNAFEACERCQCATGSERPANLRTSAIGLVVKSAKCSKVQTQGRRAFQLLWSLVLPVWLELAATVGTAVIATTAHRSQCLVQETGNASPSKHQL